MTDSADTSFIRSFSSIQWWVLGPCSCL